MSQGIGHKINSKDHDEAEKYNGISCRQLKLAQMTELIYLANEIHKDNTDNVSILIGDLLLAKVWNDLAELRSYKIVNSISSSIAHLSESYFYDLMLNENINFKNTLNEINLLNSSLLANSCLETVDLAGHGIIAQAKAHSFGKFISMALNGYDETLYFCSDENNNKSNTFKLTSLPVIIYLKEKSFNINKFKLLDGSIDYEKLFNSIITSDTAIPKAKELIKLYCDNAIEALNYFNSTNSIRLLNDIVLTLREDVS